MSHCPPQNPTCTGVELNPGFNGDRPANNRSSYGTTNTEDMELSQRVWSRRKSPGRLCNVDWSIVALRKLHFLSKRRWIFTSSHPKRLKHANFTFCETRIVIIIVRKTNKMHLYLINLFQSNYPLHVSNKPVHHQEVIPVHTVYSISHASMWCLAASTMWFEPSDDGLVPSKHVEDNNFYWPTNALNCIKLKG